MKNYFYSALAFFFGLITYSQNGVIAGKVTDDSNKFSLPGASLFIETPKKHTVSNQNGDFEFLNLTPGTYTVHVDYLGYKRTSLTVEVTPGKTTLANFQIFSDSEELEEIVIVGDFLKGQAKALNQQKNNANITNIISSDQVGRFPDANVGDALKRVSGVTMQNDQGEARNIIVRGLSPELNSVTLNGDRIPSAEGDNRNVQMDLIPADMVSSIEVNKTLTSDMDADAIGGSVNLITRAVPNKQRISATLSGGYAPIRGKGLYNGSFIYGNRFADDKLGIIASGTYQVQNFGSDNIEARWKEKDKNVFIDRFDIRKYDVQRLRRSISLSSDYVFNENNRIDFVAMYNWRDDRENRFRVRYEMKKDGWNIHRETKGGANTDRIQNTRLEDQRVINFSLKGDHLLSSKLDMKWALSYSKASEDRPQERYINYQQKKVQLGKTLASPDAIASNPLLKNDNLSNYSLDKITENHNYTQEDEFGAKIDFRMPLRVIANQKGRLRFGTRLRLKHKERENNFFEYEPVEKFGKLNQISHINYSGKGFNPGKQFAPGGFATKEFLGALHLNDSKLFNKKDQPSKYLSKNYKAKETISALYVRWDQDFTDKTSLITGLRLEQTSLSYTGNFVINKDSLLGENNRKNSYLNILPSLTLKHNFNDNFILRIATTTGIARPNYYSLAPFVAADIQGDEKEIVAGNPNLKSTYATNVDIMLENYFKNIGIVSGGAFYKHLNNFIYTYRNNSFNTNDFDQLFPDVKNPLNATDTSVFRQERNGEHVHVYGFEFAFQRQLDFLPGNFLKKFGIYTNYTFTHSKAKGIFDEDGNKRTDIGLARTAPHLFNASLSWENKIFTARLSANFTSAYLDEVGSDAFSDSYYDQQFFLDFNISYKFVKNWRIFLEANNLTNQPLRYYQGIKSRLQQVEYYQPRINLGIKYDF